MERKGERFSFIFHHEVELSMLCTGFTLDWIRKRFLLSSLDF
jgi:hypothetical protein